MDKQHPDSIRFDAEINSLRERLVLEWEQVTDSLFAQE